MPVPARDGGGRDELAHTVRRGGIEEAVAAGRPVEALCGKVWVPRLVNPAGVMRCVVCDELRRSRGLELIGGRG